MSHVTYLLLTELCVSHVLRHSKVIYIAHKRCHLLPTMCAMGHRFQSTNITSISIQGFAESWYEMNMTFCLLPFKKPSITASTSCLAMATAFLYVHNVTKPPGQNLIWYKYTATSKISNSNVRRVV